LVTVNLEIIDFEIDVSMILFAPGTKLISNLLLINKGLILL